VEYQLVLPHCHRCSAAERAIRTFKEHFVEGLSSVDTTFPFHLWGRLLPQAEMTLILLWTSRLHPQLSAAAHFHGLVDYNKTAFAPPGCKIIAHEILGKGHSWAPHGQHGYSLGPAMYHYRCQIVYISATASERIVDINKFSPQNYQMPRLSSTDRLIMAANDMMDALQNPHPDVPFTQVGDDTISALTALAEIFKLKLQRVQTPARQVAPPKVALRPFLAKSYHPMLSSPMPLPRQRRSQTTIYAQDIANASLLPRLVTPVTRTSPPPRVPTLTENLSPHNLSQDAFYDMDTAYMAIALGNQHWSHQHQANAVFHPVTGKEMEYTALMKDPHIQPLWTRGFGNKSGRLFQGIRDIPGTDTCFFIKLTNIQKDREITYGKIVCDYKPHKTEKRTSQVDRRRRQTRLFRRRRHCHGRHHNIQNPDQQHTFHRGRCHNDDGHKELLSWYSITNV
jgi:hypothetical protein